MASWEISVKDFVPDELSESNYSEWRKLMLDFVESQGLLGFIDGSHMAPSSEEETYVSWKRKDYLVRGWILTTLTKDILVLVLPYKTAGDVWTLLEARFDLSKTQEPDEQTERWLSYYRPLYIASINGDWERARRFIEREPNAVRTPITLYKETALHIACRSRRRNSFVEKLVEKMSPADLALVHYGGVTALHFAANGGNIEAAQLLVFKNPMLPNIWNHEKHIPLSYAAITGCREMVEYLWGVTPQDVIWNDGVAPPLLRNLTSGQHYDFALTLLRRKPELACIEPSPLQIIVEKYSSFRSGTSLNFWQNLIYSGVPMKSDSIGYHYNRGEDISVKPRLCDMFWEFAERFVPEVKRIRKMKFTHHQALELVKFICEEVGKSSYSTATKIFQPTLLRAAYVGNNEIVEEISASFPPLIYVSNPKNQRIIQYAIVWRREKVFNLVHQIEPAWAFLHPPDTSGNNALHLAGCLGPQQQLSLRATAAGAALQMQRELQWFKEVEKFALPGDKEQRNADGMTPAEVFTNSHQELVKEGEKWMKDTATSFTIVAALIVTVVFAAAITVPGGSDQNYGHPLFSKRKSFIIFGVSDALALFSSVTSVLMFLAILTSRYAEEDFLYALPKRLIIGLIALFFSILSMMTAFGATLYLVFGHKNEWIVYPVIALTAFPVTLFVALQFPLLWEMIKSTYGPGIFGKQSDRMLL